MSSRPGFIEVAVHGYATPNAKIEVYANEQLLDSVIDQVLFDPFKKSLGQMLYCFTVPTNLTGYVKIKIIVKSGVVKVGQTRTIHSAIVVPMWYEDGVECPPATYYRNRGLTEDNKFMVHINGVLFKKLDIDNDLDGEFEYKLKPGDCMEYYHLFKTSPPSWRLLYGNSFGENEENLEIPSIIDDGDPELTGRGIMHDTDFLEHIKKELLNKLSPAS